MWAVAASNAIAIFQWWFWGYSLAFSPTATNGYIGDLRSFALRKVLGDPSPGSPLIPELLYSFYQMEFACVTVAILMGALADRGRVFPAMIFTFIWITLVYCPIACWAWNVNGWGFKWGVLDYAGESTFSQISSLIMCSMRLAQVVAPSRLEVGCPVWLTRGSSAAGASGSFATSDPTTYRSSAWGRSSYGSGG